MTNQSYQRSGWTEDKIPSYSAKWLVRQLLGRGIKASITKAQYLTIVNNALDAGKDPALALHLGRRTNLGEMGIWGYAIISSPTHGEANQVAIQYWELNGGMVRLNYYKENNCSTWEILPAFPMSSSRLWTFAVEVLLTTFFAGNRFLSKRVIPISEIRLSYPEPDYSALYRKLFKCPIFFDQKKDLFRTSYPFENEPTAIGNPLMSTMCKQQCQELMAKLKGTDELIETIRNAIIASLGQFPRLPAIAKQLAMSSRTLRRRLQEKNTSYQQILDEIRVELVKEYIVGTNLSMDQIASRIGFAEETSFRRAFKKWTGMNIHEFRKRAGKRQEPG
jgi:AraC-like DNA-binding protein